MVRKCSVCGQVMEYGYCINDGDEYFCSEECLHEVYTEEEYKALYDADAAYWTTWEGEDEDDAPEEPVMWRVGYKAPGQSIQFREINSTVSALQGLVGGYFEIGKVLPNGVIVLCDEEGLLKEKPYNLMGLVGPLVFIGNGGEDFRSLTDGEVLDILEREAIATWV